MFTRKKRKRIQVSERELKSPTWRGDAEGEHDQEEARGQNSNFQARQARATGTQTAKTA